MSPVILLILELFGPAIKELITALLEKWLKRGAEGLDLTKYGDEKSQMVAVLDRTERALPRFARGRKLLVRKLRSAVINGVQPGDEDDVRDLLEIADNE